MANTSASSLPKASRLIAIGIFIAALFATGVATYLTWHAFAGTGVGGCSASSTFGCDEVLSTKWSKWFGMPVALFATINYLVIAGASLLFLLGPAPTKRLALTVLIPTAFLGTAAAFWFTGLQLFEVEKLCKWCLTTHTCGIVIGALVCLLCLLTWRETILPSFSDTSETLLPSGQTALIMLSGAVVAFVGLLGGQLLSKEKIEIVDLTAMSADATEDAELRPTGPVKLGSVPPTGSTEEHLQNAATSETDAVTTDAVTTASHIEVGTQASQADFKQPASATPAGVTIFPNRPPIPRNELIWIGNPNAEHVLIEFASYTCPSCRLAHPLVKSLHQEAGDQMAIVVIPIGLEKKCNPAVQRDHAKNRDSCKLTRLALAVWMIDRAAFEQLHDWMMSSEDARRYNNAWQMACSLVPESELIDVVRSDEVSQRVSQHSEYMQKFDTLPAVILGSKMIKGRAVYEGEHLREFVMGTLTST